MSTIVTPNDDTHLDCPVVTKMRTISIDAGTCPTVRWEIRDRAGAVVDISSYFPGSVDGQVIGRFRDALGDSIIHQILGTVNDAANGVVDVVLTSALTESPGIYSLEIGITDQVDADPGTYNLILVDKGLLSIERGMFSSEATRFNDAGPPTIGEIRLYLRDTAIENDLLDDVEYDDAEILDAIMRPIRQWNETPPPVAFFTPASFPFRDHWMKAITANLMRTAALWYERNRLPASHGGITVDDRSKSNPYLQISGMLEAEWREFIINKKIEINTHLAYGHIHSAYRGF